MWPRRYHILASLTEAYTRPKRIKILWNNALEDYFKELNRMVADENLLIYIYCTIPSMLYTGASDK